MTSELRIDDITDLWRTGAVHLRTAAVQFAKAAQSAHDSAADQDAAFTRTSGGRGPLYPVWTALRNRLQDEVFVKSRDNLVRAGEVLAAVAVDFAERDAGHSAELDRVREQVEDGPEYERPPTVPTAPSSDDPQ
ncbi:hypothetical protein LX16_1988 [Stackebrandtia albiflava]|uniref:Excreted virulence factor EspC (Type VII ESX diderm) n=1 Tax=Stackebrandtia albiflava TaxID=406432 RepID=A0A562VEK8_9ACTN|nr:hypothetical protein [Stackebrandtia albiflava]TWJ16261.1 hypothetical protein LX16_1988 [Stackebrandtia albiflava]